jgi:hypothetical protein
MEIKIISRKNLNCKKETREIWFHFSFKYSSIAFAAFLPAPIALITVAAPVKHLRRQRPALGGCSVSSSATTVPFLFCSVLPSL